MAAMKWFKRCLCFFALVLLGTNSVLALEKVETPTSNRVQNLPITTQLELISKAIKENDYSLARWYLESVTKYVKEKQKKSYDVYFPEELEGFRKKPIKNNLDSIGAAINKSTLFEQKYVNAKGQSIRFLLIKNDPIISEFITLIQSATLISEFEGKKIVKVSAYPAVQTTADTYMEYNIVMDQNVMVNVYFDGRFSAETIQKILSKIDFIHLNEMIKK